MNRDNGQPSPRGVHFVGSVALHDTEEVLRTAASVLGPQVRRLSDGETGERSLWILWQVPKLAANPAFESSAARGIRLALGAFARWRLARAILTRISARVSSRMDAGGGAGPRLLRVRAGVAPEDIELGPLGYAEAALTSFRVFQELKDEGVIPGPVRFQVSIPTPLGVLASFFPLEQQSVLVPVFERGLIQEVLDIAAAIPHDQLAIQWDAANEFGILEGVESSPFGPDDAETRRELIAGLVRLGDAVPADVSLGFHLCYGDFGAKHFVEPKDTRKLVDVANGVAAGLKRPLTWIHFPVPRGRSDDAYFAPLRDLQVAPETEVYAGLVHLDGVEGNRRRIDAAGRALGREFGIATECGMGRVPDPRTIPALLRMHAELAAPVGPDGLAQS